MRRLFLTPPADTESTFTRCVRVPASQEWLAVFNRALLMLTDVNNWEQESEHITPEVAAARCYTVYQEWLTGDCSLDCDDVLACLPTTWADLLSNGMINPDKVDPSDNTVISQRFPPSARAAEILPPPADCSQDAVWSAVREVVERMDQNGRDFLEAIVAQVDVIEKAGEAVALVPLLGDLVGEALQLLVDYAPTLLENYDSYSSTEVIDNIACILFDIACADCRYPTYQEIFDVYAGRSAAGAELWVDVAFEEIVSILIGTGVSPVPALVYFTTNILQIWVLSAASRWIRTVGLNSVQLWARVGSAEPSSAWEALCDGCGASTWSHTFDFKTSLYDWTIRTGRGTWVSGLGVKGTQSGTQRQVGINHAWDGTYTITKYRAEWNSPDIHLGTFSAAMRDTPEGTAYDFIVSATNVDTTPYNQEVTGQIVRSGVLLTVYGSNQSADLYLEKIVIEGVGDDPFV